MKKYTRILVCVVVTTKSKDSIAQCPPLLNSFLFDNCASLGKLVFAEPVPKDNEAATWREKLDQLYKSSSQSFRVVVHGSKVRIILFHLSCSFHINIAKVFS